MPRVQQEEERDRIQDRIQVLLRTQEGLSAERPATQVLGEVLPRSQRHTRDEREELVGFVCCPPLHQQGTAMQDSL